MADMDVSFAGMVKGRTEKQSGPETVIKEFPASVIVKSIDEKRRRVSGMASTDTLDRCGEVIEAEAFREYLPRFMANPVLMAAHQHRLADGHSPVVGSVVRASIVKHGLFIVCEFEEGTELGNEYWTLYKNKRQRAFSIGFKPIESERQQRDGEFVEVFTKVELLEISCVAVPANPETLSKSQRRKHDFVQGKRLQREEDRILAELRAEDPDFDRKAEEFAEAILGVTTCDENIVQHRNFHGLSIKRRSQLCLAELREHGHSDAVIRKLMENTNFDMSLLGDSSENTVDYAALVAGG